MIYFLGLLGMKVCVFFIFHLLPWIVIVGDWALKWTEGNETVQVFFVMLLFPVIMNAIQYYIIDSFIKNSKPADHEPIPSEDGEDGEGDVDAQGRRRHSVNEDLLDSEDEAEILKDTAKIRDDGMEDKPVNSSSGSNSSSSLQKSGEYNPDTDGEEISTVGKSGSGFTGANDRALLPKATAERK